MSLAWIGLGSNLEPREEHLARAVEELRESGLEVLRVSHLYETRPEGGAAEPDYLNAVLQAETDLDPRRLLDLLHAIESRLGRNPARRAGPRTVDLDLLALGALVLEEPDGMTLPHPRLDQRAFVLVPLCELDPLWVHPKLERTASELLTALPFAAGEVRLHGRVAPGPQSVEMPGETSDLKRHPSPAR